MPSVVLADIDHRIVDIISLVGLILGIFGSLFFTYDLLGRPGGFLRLIIRVTIPAVLGAVVFAGLALLAFRILTPTEDPVGVLVDVLLFAALGASVGTFNGLFVDAPNADGRPRFFFSLKDAAFGLLAVILYVWLAILILPLAFNAPVISVFTGANASFTFAAGGVGGIAAGFWRRINRSRDPATSRPRPFSAKGCLIGIAMAVVLCLVALLTSLGVATGSLTANEVIGVVFLVAIAGIPGGGITGGISRYLFWWANSLPPRGLEVIGVMLILLAFLAQVIEPTLGLLNITPK